MWSRCHRDIALTLAASFPSGFDVVVQIRRELWEAILGTPLAVPRVPPLGLRHLKDPDEAVHVHEIYVGPGIGSYPPSVWSDPGCWPVPGIDNFAEYLFQRADLDVLGPSEWENFGMRLSSPRLPLLRGRSARCGGVFVRCGRPPREQRLR